jgi:tetratricopeptide (TPR) repeat protein
MMLIPDAIPGIAGNAPGLQDCNAASGMRRQILSLILLLCSFAAISQPDFNFKQAAVNHLRNGEYLEALENLNTAILRTPGVSDLYFLRGFAKYGLDDFLGAEIDYSRSIEISPVMAEVFINRGIVRSIQQNFTGAFEDFKKAEELAPENPEIYANRARTNLFLKNYYSCLVDCRKALDLKYKHESIYILMGSSELGIKRYENAIENFTTAIRINPENPASYIQLGQARMELNQPDSAIQCYTRALSVDSNNTLALFNRSLAMINTKNLNGALNDLNRIIRLSPYNSYAWFNRAILLINLDDKAGAIRDLGTVIALNPQNIISYYYRGLLRSEINDYRGALADLDKTIELYPEYPNAYYSRFEVKMRMKDRAGAMADQQRAMELAAKNHLDPATLKAQKNYLESLVKLSGDFEEMNTMSAKFQNQYIDIQLLPMYSVFIGKLNFDQITFYDTYGKPNYHTNIISLTRHPGLVKDSVWRKEIRSQTRHIDSVPSDAAAHYRRALAYTALRNFNSAFADYDTVLQLNPKFTMAYFSRAGARYELIQLLRSQDDSRREISIATGDDPDAELRQKQENETAYADVIRDLDSVILLDPAFPFAWYNRGFVHCQMGNYPAALSDFSRALENRERFGEAYFSRGLICLLLNDKSHGCEDLSRAGELGIGDAYRVMKRYCYK